MLNLILDLLYPWLRVEYVRVQNSVRVGVYLSNKLVYVTKSEKWRF